LYDKLTAQSVSANEKKMYQIKLFSRNSLTEIVSAFRTQMTKHLVTQFLNIKKVRSLCSLHVQQKKCIHPRESLRVST